MSCSKPLPPFTFDVLCYFNRDQLERFSIVCRPLKNFIDRYFHSKPWRVFDQLVIRSGLYLLRHNGVQWHPNRDDYSVQQFLAGQPCKNGHYVCYSYAAMCPYLGPSVRIKKVRIEVAGRSFYKTEHITEMESIARIWQDGDIFIRHTDDVETLIVAKNFQLILNSPTILQCRELEMYNAHFQFREYKVLYTLKVIEIRHNNVEDIDLWLQYWHQFLEQPGPKPGVVFSFLRREYINNLFDRISKAFSSAVSPNAFKVAFVLRYKSLAEFREMNNTSREILELKKGFPSEYPQKHFQGYDYYTLERSSI
ncbi:hypothetical protein Ddc_15647 [Ditylenchus destructor]|nr:hypothetical protein Ddc_15647 [Ditylenchus destructor]